jgi:hypothetical protein
LRTVRRLFNLISRTVLPNCFLMIPSSVLVMTWPTSGLIRLQTKS